MSAIGFASNWRAQGGFQPEMDDWIESSRGFEGEAAQSDEKQTWTSHNRGSSSKRLILAPSEPYPGCTRLEWEFTPDQPSWRGAETHRIMAGWHLNDVPQAAVVLYEGRSVRNETRSGSRDFPAGSRISGVVVEGMSGEGALVRDLKATMYVRTPSCTGCRVHDGTGQCVDSNARCTGGCQRCSNGQCMSWCTETQRCVNGACQSPNMQECDPQNPTTTCSECRRCDSTGTCQPVQSDARCNGNCVGGQCQSAGCLPPGQAAVEPDCGGVFPCTAGCRRVQNGGSVTCVACTPAACHANAPCEDTACQDCEGGRCVNKPDDTACPNGRCQNGRCTIISPGHAECDENRPCRATCYTCSPAGNCVPRTGTDARCVGGTCENGMCKVAGVRCVPNGGMSGSPFDGQASECCSKWSEGGVCTCKPLGVQSNCTGSGSCANCCTNYHVDGICSCKPDDSASGCPNGPCSRCCSGFSWNGMCTASPEEGEGESSGGMYLIAGAAAIAVAGALIFSMKR